MKSQAVALTDVPAMHALTRRWEEFWNSPEATSLAEIEDDLQDPHLALESQTNGYWDADRLVGYGFIWHRPSGIGHERAFLPGQVDPEFRNLGVGRELLAWQIDGATKLLNAIDNDLPKYVRVNEWDWIDEAHRMYRRFGLEPVRYITEMLKVLDGTEELDVDGEFEVIRFDRSLDEEARAVQNRAFEDHWGSTPIDSAGFQHRLNRHGTDLDISFLAIAGEEVIGLCLNGHYPEDTKLSGRTDGWVESLGVLRAWRKKGVATALLKSSFNAFVERGYSHSAIGVDTANPTGALRLYSNLGYVPTHRSIISETRVG